MNEIINEINNILNNIINKLCLNIEYELNNKEEEIYINFKGDDAKLLNIKKMKILNDIKIIILNSLKNITHEKIILNLDVLNYKQKREEFLTNLTLKKIREVKITKKSIKLKPMPANERRIIHLLVQNDNELETKSIGYEPNRSVIIKLKNIELYNNEDKINFKKNGIGKKKTFGRPKRTLI